MKTALHTISYGGVWAGQARLRLEEIVAKAVELGFDGLLLAAKRPHLSPLDYDTGACAELRKTIQRSGLEVCALAAYTDFTANPERPDVPTAEMQAVALRRLGEMASELECPVIRVFTGYERAGLPADRAWATCVHWLRESARQVAPLGVTLAVQNHHDIAVHYESMAALLEEVGEVFAQVISGDLEHRRMSQKLLRLSAVQEEGFDLLSETDRERLTIMITSSAAMLVDAEAVILRVLEKKGKRLLVASTHGLHKNEIDSRLVQMDGLSALKTFQGRSAQVLEDLRKMDQTLPQKFQYLSGICLPLVYEGVTLGTLSVYNKLAFQTFGCTAFDQDDMEILDKFSYYVGKALINAQEAQARSTLITIDEVTGLRNERYLMLRLPEELRRAERYQRSLSLMIFEVKSEAKIQPAEGSSTEKEFIKQVAEVLQETFRNVDILVRVKGTQFAILMPDTGEAVTDAAARLARSLASLPLKIFIGYSTYPTEAKTVQDLIGKASKLSGMVRDI